MNRRPATAIPGLNPGGNPAPGTPGLNPGRNPAPAIPGLNPGRNPAPGTPGLTPGHNPAHNPGLDLGAILAALNRGDPGPNTTAIPAALSGGDPGPNTAAIPGPSFDTISVHSSDSEAEIEGTVVAYSQYSGQDDEKDYDDDEEPTYNRQMRNANITMDDCPVAFRRVGYGYGLVSQRGPKRCGQYRLVSGSQRRDWVDEAMKGRLGLYNASDLSIRMLLKPENRSCYMGIGGVAHREEVDFKEWKAGSGRAPDILLKITWEGAESSWETRTDFRKFIGNKKAADKEILDAAVHYKRIWEEYIRGSPRWDPDLNSNLAPRRRQRSKTPGFLGGRGKGEGRKNGGCGGKAGARGRAGYTDGIGRGGCKVAMARGSSRRADFRKKIAVLKGGGDGS
ncbi:hypothetical protein HOY80DRAFT_997174 [Tuber brumale]|nr:hypothetical protein HOY80DRAFT_997174 [Tuber brumale]